MAHFELVDFPALVLAVHVLHLVLYLVVFHRGWIGRLNMECRLVRNCIGSQDFSLEIRLNTLKQPKFHICHRGVGCLLEGRVSVPIVAQLQSLRGAESHFLRTGL